MARENQGLQIAVIIFVILNLVLAVTTFVFFKQYDEASKRAVAAEQQAQENKRAADNTLRDNEQLKQYVGVPTTMKVDEIGEQVRTDFDTYAPNYQGETRNYHSVLEYLATTLKSTNESLAAAQAENEQLKEQIRQLEVSKAPLVAQEQSRADTANNQLAQERNKFTQDRQQLTEQAQQVQARLVSFQQEASQEIGKFRTDLKNAQDELKLALLKLKDRSDQLRKVTEPTFETADGQVRWVNLRTGRLWINLGRSDALLLQTTFAVYPAEVQDVSKAGSKGKIEVTEILGDHLAEARIIEDSPSNPIIPGDQIHTVVWSPGQRQHFALTDGIDMDGDGKSDLQTVLSIIAMSGGAVDCYLDDEGKKTGQITSQTRYVIVGKSPDETATQARRDARTKMERDADTYGLTRLTLGELLSRMGWKNEAQVRNYAGGASPAQLRAQPPEGGMPVSTGNVSPLFEPRRPPARKTTY